MKVKDVMTTRVVAIEPDAGIAAAARLMLQHRISGLPVVEKGELAGIVTEGDFLRRSEAGTQRRRSRWLEFLIGPGRLAEEYVRASGRKVYEVMSPEPHTIEPDATLEDAVSLMERYGVKRLPVVSNGRLVGIVTRANLLHALASIARETRPAEASDAEIREHLLKHLEGQPWAPVGAINPIVRNGVVELWGTIMDERERQALVVAAENTAGVKKVRDRLAWVDPHSGMVFYAPEEEIEAKAS